MSNYYQEPRTWIDGSTAESQIRQRSFIRTVYAWMFGGLLLTALSSFFVASSPVLQRIFVGNPIVPWVLLFGLMGLVVAISAGVNRFAPPVAASLFCAFALLNGLSLSAIFFVYTRESIVQAFVTAAGMFGVMSIYGLVTKRDLTSWGSFFFMGLIGIVICSVVNFFLHSAMISFLISFVGVFVFIGLTAYDTQKLKSFATVGGRTGQNLAIVGALSLYLDFVNLFLMLLRLFGGGRRR
jgi:FtsH-binding integral membrane protein